MPAGQIAAFILGSIIVIFGAYYVTYYVGVKSTKLRRGAGRSIILRDRFSISKDKSFCLVEICGKVYIIGVTNHTITLLDTLKAEELAESDIKREAYQSGVYQNSMISSIISFLTSLINKWRSKSNQVRKNTEVRGTFAQRLQMAVRKAEEQNTEGIENPQSAEVEDEDEPSCPEGKE